MKKTPKPDKRTQRREAIKAALQALDSTITTIEFLEEPGPPDEAGNCWADLWLFRVGSNVPPEEVSVLVNLEARRIFRVEHPGA